MKVIDRSLSFRLDLHQRILGLQLFFFESQDRGLILQMMRLKATCIDDGCIDAVNILAPYTIDCSLT